MHRRLRNYGATTVAPKKVEQELEEPIENVEAAPEALVASDPAPENGRRACTSRRTVKEIVADYQAEMERRKAARSAPMIMGAPPPELNIDVATDVLQIANRRAATLALGKATGESGPYTGIRINNNLNNPDRQPAITIGGLDNGVARSGSVVAIQGDRVSIIALQELDSNTPGVINIIGTVLVNGFAVSGVSYLERWATAADVLPTNAIGIGAAVPFPQEGTTSGDILYSAPNFVISPDNWGTYLVSWRIAVTGASQFALKLADGSGPLASPDNGVLPNTVITRTTAAIGAAGMATGQAMIVVPNDPDADPVIISLVNSGGAVAPLYVAAGNPIDITITRVVQAPPIN